MIGKYAQEMTRVVVVSILRDLEDEQNKERASQRMQRTLLNGFIDKDLPRVSPETLSPQQRCEANIIEGFIGLYTQVETIRECQYYFRRYPFRGLHFSRAKHLTNCCEMYFDRIVQFRDRMKTLLNAIKRAAPQAPVPVARMLRLFDKIFAFEIRNRNHTHHHGRFDTDEIRQLGLIHILSVGERTANFSAGIEDDLFRKAARGWVKSIQQAVDLVEQFVDQAALIILDVCEFVQPLREQSISAIAAADDSGASPPAAKGDGE
jgi:hypothetical protein